jgi:hypothetical protein
MEIIVGELTKAGLTEEQAKKVVESHKTAIKDKYIPIERFNEVNEELKTSKSTIADRDKQITGLKKFEGDTAALKEEITKLQQDNTKKAQEMESALTAERLKNAMSLQLTGKVHDVDIVLGKVDVSKVSVGSDGNLIGFTEQVEALKKDKAFLFVKEKPADEKPKFDWFVTGNKPPEGKKDGINPSDKPDPIAEIGKKLAEARLAQQKNTDAGLSHYFPTPGQNGG